MKNWAKNGRIPGKTLLSGIVLLFAQIHVIALADQCFGQKLVQFQGVVFKFSMPKSETVVVFGGILNLLTNCSV